MMFVACDGKMPISEEGSTTPAEPQNPEIPSESQEPEMPSDPQEPTTSQLSAPQIGFSGFVRYSNPPVAAVWMSTSVRNAQILYTTNGSTPSEKNVGDYNWKKMTLVCDHSVVTGIPVEAGTTIKAVTFLHGEYSDVITFKVPMS